jgi:hypothetical protein
MSALGVDPAGNVYFTGSYLGSQTDYVFRVTEDGGFNAIYGSTAAPLHLLNGLSLAVGVNGDVWLASGALAVLNSSGQFAIGIQEGGDAGDGGPAQLARFNTTAVAFAPNGDLYILDNDRVRKLTGVARAKAPAISAAGIVNAFSYAGGPIAPGELVSIFGSGFATEALQVAAPVNNRFPWGLGRLKVFFNGYPGAITAATPTQINVFVPDWLSPGTPVTVVVQLDDATSAPVEIPVAKAAPGLFATAVGSGNILTLYGTGEGFHQPAAHLGRPQHLHSLLDPHRTSHRHRQRPTRRNPLPGSRPLASSRHLPTERAHLRRHHCPDSDHSRGIDHADVIAHARVG